MLAFAPCHNLQHVVRQPCSTSAPLSLFSRRLRYLCNNMTNTGRSLIDFIKNHCDYVSIVEPNEPSSSNNQQLQDEKCPICYTPLTEATSHIIQVNLDTCHHFIDHECFSRYIFAGYHNCPFCRMNWFDPPDGTTTTLATVSPGLNGRDFVMAVAPLMNRSTDGEGEITWLSMLMRTHDANIPSSGPVGSGPLFQEWPDWVEQQLDDTVVESPFGRLPLRLRRENANIGGAHDYRRARSRRPLPEFGGELTEAEAAEEIAFAEENLSGTETLENPASDSTQYPEGTPVRRVWDHYWRGWVDEEGDVDGV